MKDQVFYHKTSALYEPGDRILPGNWGRLTLGNGPTRCDPQGRNNFFREYVFERVREAEFPGLPSRMRSAFVCETPTATNWLGTEGLIYVVQWETSDVPLHRGDLTWFDVFWSHRTYEGIDYCARQFWTSRERTPDAWELFGESALTVLSRMTQIGENGVH